VAFGAFAFSPDSADVGGLVVPRVVAGQRDGRAWVTSIEALDDSTGAPPADAPQHPGTPSGTSGAEDPADGIRLVSGAVAARDWPAVIRAGIERIEAGEVDKVVLARDVLAVAQRPIDTVALLRRLAARYAATWTFAVDGLI